MNEAGASITPGLYTLDQINQAAEDSEKESTIKPVIRMQ